MNEELCIILNVLYYNHFSLQHNSIPFPNLTSRPNPIENMPFLLEQLSMLITSLEDLSNGLAEKNGKNVELAYWTNCNLCVL